MERTDDWLLATLIMLVLSLLVFMVQTLFVRVLDPVFEACIFYIPTAVLFLIYIMLRLKGRITQ